jgi:hypothetical protein
LFALLPFLGFGLPGRLLGLPLGAIRFGALADLLKDVLEADVSVKSVSVAEGRVEDAGQLPRRDEEILGARPEIRHRTAALDGKDKGSRLIGVVAAADATEDARVDAECALRKPDFEAPSFRLMGGLGCLAELRRLRKGDELAPRICAYRIEGALDVPQRHLDLLHLATAVVKAMEAHLRKAQDLIVDLPEILLEIIANAWSFERAPID